MMGSTHVLFGMMIAYVGSYFMPELAVPITVACIVGSIFPDLDMPYDHRKTLHYTVYYSAGALISFPLFLFNTTLVTAIFSSDS